MSNPFDIVSAELMDPKEVAAEFVRDHTEYSKLAAYSHTVVWGSRGSGKSMHFKFMEPRAQAWRKDLSLNGNVHEYLKQPGAFLGIYVNCRDGILNREELRRVGNLPKVDMDFLHIIFNRYMASVILLKMCTTISEQLPLVVASTVKRDGLPEWAKILISEREFKFGVLIERVKEFSKSIIEKLGKLIDDHFLCSPKPPRRENFPQEAPRLNPDVIDFLEYVRASIGIMVPFFLLFDEANELSAIHQLCIASLIGHRSQKTLCVKVASQRHGYRRGQSLEGQVDETHDYTSLDLDELYTSHQEAYYGRLKAIGNWRLHNAGIRKDIAEYLPANSAELKALEKAKNIAAKRYAAIPIEKRPLDKLNFIKKYAPAIIYQEILSHKARKSYAGFDNLVHLSSGIVRSFLDCCSRMYTRYTEKNPGQEPESIPISIQDTIIREYADEFIQAQILDKIEELDPRSKEYKELQQLRNLLLGLGTLFRARLMDKDSREPRIISISLKDQADDELKRVLDLAEREAFLHYKWYRSKRGDHNLQCYVLNRRLCPHFNLDASGFQGRLEVSADELKQSITDPKGFSNRILRRRSRAGENATNQIGLFEW